MTYTFRPQGVCSREMRVELDDQGVIQKMEALGGCSGNLQGISALVVGMTAEEAASTIFGIDILPDNVQQARARLLELLPGTEDILARNIVCGDFLRPETVWFLAAQPKPEKEV